MPALLNLLSIYPILDQLVPYMGLGDVIRLSRVSSQYRAVLHGFELPATDESPRLRIGEHRTALWESLKSKSVLRCAETRHRPTRHTIKSCRICSFPVCEACVIRDSFNKPNELTFHNRSRRLCAKCWSTGGHQKRQLLDQGSRECDHGLGPSGAGDVCACSAKDGHLCLECKIIQNAKSVEEIGKCYGEACKVSLDETEMGRVCLWCDLALPGGVQRAASRRQYDIKHLHARSHSAYERPEEPESDDKANETKRRKLAMLHDDRRHRYDRPSGPDTPNTTAGSRRRQILHQAKRPRLPKSPTVSKRVLRRSTTRNA